MCIGRCGNKQKKTEILFTAERFNVSEGTFKSLLCSVSHLLVRQPGHRVDILLLDHEGSQVGSVGSQENDCKKGPDQDHDFTGGSFGVFNGDWVVKDYAPQEPNWFPYGECWTARSWEGEKKQLEELEGWLSIYSFSQSEKTRGKVYQCTTVSQHTCEKINWTRNVFYIGPKEQSQLKQWTVYLVPFGTVCSTWCFLWNNALHSFQV